MAVGAHALLALVLVDLRLSALFERSHVGGVLGLLWVGPLVDDFVQRVLDDAFGTQ
jgi:hypothetical protein